MNSNATPFVPLYYQKLNENATIPTKATPSSVGLDLYMIAPFTIIPAFSTTLIDIGIRFIFPPNTYGRIASKSGLALHNGIIVITGVIDPDYQGSVHVVLHNLTALAILIPKSQACAQLILENYTLPYLSETPSCGVGSVRGTRGFGQCEP